MGRAVARVLAWPPGRSHGHYPAQADIPGTFPSPRAAADQHRLGVGVVG